MKVEFKQKQTELLRLDNLNDEQFLSLAIETSKKLGWILGYENQTGFIGYTNNGVFAWNAEIKVKISNGFATLQSHSQGNEMRDVIGNKKNLQNFITTFSNLKQVFLLGKPEPAYKNLLSETMPVYG